MEASERPQEHDHTRAREIALKILYQVDVGAVTAAPELQVLIDESIERELEELSLPAKSARAVERYTRRLSFGVVGARAELDGHIQAVAKNWEIQRMAAVDRNVLRIGAFEILRSPDIPRAVAINEAIEIARKYSTEESGTFVNGILDQIQRSGEAPARRDDEAPSTPALER